MAVRRLVGPGFVGVGAGQVAVMVRFAWPGAADGDVLVTGRCGVHGLGEQAMEQQAWLACLASVEAELELAQVLLEVLQLDRRPPSLHGEVIHLNAATLIAPPESVGGCG